MDNLLGYCGNVLSPALQYVRSGLASDMDQFVQSLYEADPTTVAHCDCLETANSPAEQNVLELVPLNDLDNSISDSLTLTPQGLVLNGRRTPLIPTIIITPAPYQPREKSSLVPIQDTSFGARLAVPSHLPLNNVHPPMALSASAPQVWSMRGWNYRHGHWYAVVPHLDEQDQRGLFSRPIWPRRNPTFSLRRIKSRRCDGSTRLQNTVSPLRRNS